MSINLISSMGTTFFGPSIIIIIARRERNLQGFCPSHRSNRFNDFFFFFLELRRMILYCHEVADEFVEKSRKKVLQI